MTATDGYRLKSIAEGAKYLGVKQTTLRLWIRKGFIPIFRLGSRVLIDEADLNAYIAARRHPARSP